MVITVPYQKEVSITKKEFDWLLTRLTGQDKLPSTAHDPVCPLTYRKTGFHHELIIDVHNSRHDLEQMKGLPHLHKTQEGLWRNVSDAGHEYYLTAAVILFGIDTLTPETAISLRYLVSPIFAIDFIPDNSDDPTISAKRFALYLTYPIDCDSPSIDPDVFTFRANELRHAVEVITRISYGDLDEMYRLIRKLKSVDPCTVCSSELIATILQARTRVETANPDVFEILTENAARTSIFDN